ncbi:MAG TPA: glutathione S-transferase C-terminal domain-containing protein [Gammaproteobacteria bacterium]|nr:glutathione S-transferase C-terminal domain-containing protein [Gammaproteobacteria bacterium]
MIDLYSWTTPNGYKVHIMLEEIGLEYAAHPVDIGKGDQFKPEFLKISPNNKIPAIVDREGPDGRPQAIFESGAILVYLAEKSGKLLSTAPRERIEALKWLFFQAGSVGPMIGQIHHFRDYAEEKIQYAIERYTNEGKRLYGVMDKRLAEAPYFAGDDYSIADIAIWPWLRNYEKEGIVMDEYPHVKAWFDKIGERPAVQRGLQVLQEYRHEGPMSEREKEFLFGKTQYQKR